MAREGGWGREETAGLLSLPAAQAAGPEGCKTTSLRGGRDIRDRYAEKQNKARFSGDRAAAVDRGCSLWRSLHSSPWSFTSPATELGHPHLFLARRSSPRPVALQQINPPQPSQRRRETNLDPTVARRRELALVLSSRLGLGRGSWPD